MASKKSDSWPKNSVGEFLGFLCPGRISTKCPTWPPDVFALSASLLQATGAYVRLVEVPPTGSIPVNSEWPETALQLGQQWQDLLPEVPAEVAQDWKAVADCFENTLDSVLQDDHLCEALLRLCLVADQASHGVGLKSGSVFLEVADFLLDVNRYRSLCHHINVSKVSVLPKQHTTQKGMTLRSLTHHLALVKANEVTVTWRTPVEVRSATNPDILNILLLPWPQELETEQFSSLKHSPPLPDPYRYFEFRQNSDRIRVKTQLEKAIGQARQFANHIDVIVLPELAMTSEEYLAAESVAIEHEAMLVAGLLIRGSEGEEFGLRRTESPALKNYCVSQPVGMTSIGSEAGGSQPTGSLIGSMRILQSKHHRWFLDRNQIIQYGLGGRLSASKLYWEYSEIGTREVNFFTLREWLTFCVLICEDLARQDPVADILRAVGPNLVIGLLMDGPQLIGRWPSKCAHVLADDPGSSVLTLTSLGMSQRSKPRDVWKKATDRSRVIALWQDAQYGAIEIELPEGTDACVLSLAGESKKEFTADGRHEQRYFPVYAGYHPFATDSSDADAVR